MQCIEECSFIASGYIEIDPPFVLDLPVITYNLKQIMPQPQHISLPFMLRAYAVCGAYRECERERESMKALLIHFLQLLARRTASTEAAGKRTGP